jgi:hypothetical protein
MEVEITMGMKTKHLIPIMATNVVAAATSFAQLPPAPAAATEQIAGAVGMYLLIPRGEVDGLLLADGTQVKFPPHMSADLTRTVRPGDSITAQGVREAFPVFTAFTITNATSGQSLNEVRPTQPPPPNLRGVNLTPMQADGKIKALLHAPRGEIEGAVLDNGTIVRIAPRASEQFMSIFQTGAAISARGYGTQNEFGSCFESTEIGAAGQTLTPVYGAPPPR